MTYSTRLPLLLLLLVLVVCVMGMRGCLTPWEA
jgi:hypothetical protein